MSNVSSQLMMLYVHCSCSFFLLILLFLIFFPSHHVSPLLPGPLLCCLLLALPHLLVPLTSQSHTFSPSPFPSLMLTHMENVVYSSHVCMQGGRTALYFASKQGHVTIVRLLLEAYADISICRKVCKLHSWWLCSIDLYI